MGIQAAAITTTKHRARVISYNRDKGQGWLLVEGYPHDLYLHGWHLRHAEVPIPPDRVLQGTRLLCNVGEYKGRPVAVDLELLED